MGVIDYDAHNNPYKDQHTPENAFNSVLLYGSIILINYFNIKRTL